MAIEVRWYVEDRITNAVIWGSFTMKEMIDGGNEAIALIRAGGAKGHVVHDIIDMRGMREYPKELSEIVKATPIFKEPSLGWVILLSNDKLVNFLATIATSVARARFRAFRTPEEALKFLQEVDPTLPPLPEYHGERVKSGESQ